MWIHSTIANPNYIMTAGKVFVTISLFDILRYPLTRLPMTIAYIIQVSIYYLCYCIIIFIQANVSLKRIRSFLLEEELDLTGNDGSDTATDGKCAFVIIIK